MKAVLMPALALALLSGCAANVPQAAPKKAAAAPARTAMICSQERRTGSHVSTSSCITQEQADARREESLRAMRALKQPKPSGSAAGQN